MPGLDDRLHALLAREHGPAVHAHAARAADHHPAALAVRERAVVLVLDQVEHVEEAGPLRRLDLVFAQRALARLRVEAPDLERDVHYPLLPPPPSLLIRSTTDWRGGALIGMCVPKSCSSIVTCVERPPALFVS